MRFLSLDRVLAVMFMGLVACTSVPSLNPHTQTQHKHKHIEEHNHHCEHCRGIGGEVDKSCRQKCESTREDFVYSRAPQSGWPIGWSACNKCLRWMSQSSSCYQPTCFVKCVERQRNKGVAPAFLRRMSKLVQPCSD